jgi:two-component system sensor histidine kinase/response regulator
MPEMDGYQATARLRAQGRFANLPIVAMTAHATVEERDRCTAAGMNGHVAKPIDPAALYDALSRYRPASPAVPAVEEIDTQQGLRRVAGNAKLYWRLLGQFIDGQADAVQQIANSLASGDRATAERHAHTVKGTAGNLAAGPVQEAAGALEKAIHDGVPSARIDQLRTRLGEAMGRLAAAVRPLIGAAAPAPPPAAPPPAALSPAAAPVDPAALKPVVERWSKLLAECDAASVQDLEREAAALRGLFDGAEAYGRFAQLVSAYDFDAALETLRQAAASRGV